MLGGRRITDHMMGYVWVFITALLTWTMHWTLVSATEADEQSANKVTIEIYMLSLSDWNDGANMTFATSLVNAANDFCGGSDYSKCDFANSGWENTHPFNETEVISMTPDASFESSYLEYTFALNYPTGSDHAGSTLDYVIAKETLINITVACRDAFYEATGNGIIGIDGVEYPNPPNRDLNIIISVVAVLITLGLLATCLLLRVKCGRGHEPVEKESHSKGELELQSVTTANSIKPMMIDTPRETNGNKQILVASADVPSDNIAEKSAADYPTKTEIV